MADVQRKLLSLHTHTRHEIPETLFLVRLPRGLCETKGGGSNGSSGGGGGSGCGARLGNNDVSERPLLYPAKRKVNTGQDKE